MIWPEILGEIKKALSIRSVDIARATGTSTSYITEIEKGKSKNPKSGFIQALITELNINPYWLFKGEGEVIAKNQQRLVSYDDLQVLREISAYDLVMVAKEIYQQKGPPGNERTPDQSGETDQG